MLQSSRRRNAKAISTGRRKLVSCNSQEAESSNLTRSLLLGKMSIPGVTVGQGLKASKQVEHTFLLTDLLARLRMCGCSAETKGLSLLPLQGFGCMGLTAGFYGASCSEEQGISVLQKALKAGATTISTADFYGNGLNEELIGEPPSVWST